MELMKGKGYGQEDFGGFRFQLAYMAYALALTHKHRLPAAPGLFKPIFERLIEKILCAGSVDVLARRQPRRKHLQCPSRGELPGRIESGRPRQHHVQRLRPIDGAILYDYLFNDNRYAQPGALTFRFWSYFWGGKEKCFEYDQNSLNDHIYWQMVQSGYLGVACEPNCVFQICNQPAILGFRMHDLINGGSIAEEVARSYEQASKDSDASATTATITS